VGEGESAKLTGVRGPLETHHPHRFFIFLERRIYESTQWRVCGPNPLSDV